MNVLSIQSAVAYGCAGNSAAVFPLQRLGATVWPIFTVQFSNHAGYPTARGMSVQPDDLAAVFLGVAERGVLSACDAILSGYLGAAGNGAVLLDAVARVKAENPKAIFLCDPVIGDVAEGVYVVDGIPEFYRDTALPVADIVTPNAFELSHLTGRSVDSVASILAAANELLNLGPDTVVVTSVRPTDLPADTVSVLAANRNEAWLLTTPFLNSIAKGPGDVLAALFLFGRLSGHPIRIMLETSCASLFGVIEATAAAGDPELRLIESQEEFVWPGHRFSASRLR
jgi:pyridoxine kinase